MADMENREEQAVEIHPEAEEIQSEETRAEEGRDEKVRDKAVKEKDGRDKEEDEVDLGTVRIADDVVAMIAGYTAKDVDGVADMAGSNTSGFLRSAGYRRPVKGVRVEVNDGNVRVDLAVIMEYGYNIPATSSRVQARVKQAIENMTGLTVQDVNVRIAGIHMPGSAEE